MQLDDRLQALVLRHDYQIAPLLGYRPIMKSKFALREAKKHWCPNMRWDLSVSLQQKARVAGLTPAVV